MSIAAISMAVVGADSPSRAFAFCDSSTLGLYVWGASFRRAGTAQSWSISSGPLMTAPPIASMIATLNLPQRYSEFLQPDFCFRQSWLCGSGADLALASLPALPASASNRLDPVHRGWLALDGDSGD